LAATRGAVAGLRGMPLVLSTMVCGAADRCVLIAGHRGEEAFEEVLA